MDERALRRAAFVCDRAGRRRGDLIGVRVLTQSAGVVLEYDWRAFSAIGADIGDADLLGVPAGTPLLVREGVSCAPGGQPVLFVRRRINGERARFVLNFRPDGEG